MIMIIKNSGVKQLPKRLQSTFSELNRSEFSPMIAIDLPLEEKKWLLYYLLSGVVRSVEKLNTSATPASGIGFLKEKY